MSAGASQGGYETRKIATVLGQVHVHMAGKGPAMVCWPSLLMNGLMWDGQAQHFQTTHRMILIDSPGHGQSQPLSRRFTLEECALCLRQILDELGIEQCVLVGNSWGGMMGGVFAALYPQRTRAAILMNCTGSAAGIAQKIEFFAMVSVLRHLSQVPDRIVGRAVKAFAGPTTEHNKPDVVAFIRDTVAGVNPRSVCWAIESVVPRRVDQRQLLGAVRVPVLVVAGDEDRTFAVAETQAMAAAIPGAKFAVLNDVGHLAALEAPQRVNAQIESFLAELGD